MTVQERLLAWWRANNGVYIGLDGIQEHIVLHRPPEATDVFPTPLLLGPALLQAKTLGSLSTDTLVANMATRVPKYANAGLDDYERALKTWRPVIDILRITGSLTCGETDLTYLRMLLPARTTKGARMVLTYSEPTTLH